MGVVVARLMTGDFVEARNRAEMFAVGDLFSRWLAALGQTFALTALRESGLLVAPSGLTDLVVMQTLRVRVRVSTFARPTNKVTPHALIQRFALLGPRCTPDGEVTEEPADFYAQVVIALSTNELRQLFAREVGTVSAVLVGAAALPQVLERGTPRPVAGKWFVTLPLTDAIAAADLPIYLREAAARLQLRNTADATDSTF
jgi:hypothetical protein